ncbi:MAG: arylsulfatase, partial [Planctomycetota bacterium]|nr:arylsulfatase [Planctomycetota bacterium]
MKHLLVALALPLAIAASPRRLAAADAAGKPPNVIYILADDLGYGDISCLNKNSKIPTPNIDRLAAEGISFTDAHSASAVCTPTRYGVLTGRYCWRTSLKKGVLYGYSPPLIEPTRMTVASLLKQHGYDTACIGKWHLGLTWARKDGVAAGKLAENGEDVDFTKPIKGGPTELGFDHFYGISASLDMPPYTYIENARVVKLPTEQAGKGEFGRAGLKAPGFEAVNVLPDLTKKAVEFIDGHAADKPARPFFLYFPVNAPHTPIAPADMAKGKSQAGKYGDFVAEVDWTVGEVMKCLERNKLGANTLLIVTSDNGSSPHGFPEEDVKKYDHQTSYHFRGRKSDAWDGGHHIPFIARWPGKVKAGSVSDEIICLNDLMATCAALVGAKLPDGAGEDSYNILP